MKNRRLWSSKIGFNYTGANVPRRRDGLQNRLRRVRFHAVPAMPGRAQWRDLLPVVAPYNMRQTHPAQSVGWVCVSITELSQGGFYYAMKGSDCVALTPKQKRFVEEYLIDLNATQAAVRAGYSEKTARAIGQENLTKPDIQDAIQKAMGKRSKRVGITQDRVLEALAGMGFSEVDMDSLKPTDKLKALELIGKHLGMFDGKSGQANHETDGDNLYEAITEAVNTL